MHNYENEHILDMISDEFSWPASDRALLAWYMNRLGLNRLILLWQEQSLENEHHRPKSPYRAFRARLSRSLGHSSIGSDPMDEFQPRKSRF